MFVPYGVHRCPFGIRDLQHDSCYSGSGQNRCEFFRRYIWHGEYSGTIQCTCTAERVDQLQFNFEGL